MTIKIRSEIELKEVSGAGANGRDDGKVGVGKNSSTSCGGQGGGFVGTPSRGMSLGELARRNPCAVGVITGIAGGSWKGGGGVAKGAISGALGGGCFW